MKTLYLNNVVVVDDPVPAGKVVPFENRDSKWFEIRNQTKESADIYIYDEISPYAASAKGVVAQLNALKEVPLLNVRINSPGGSVFEGMAIFNALTRHPGTVNVYVDGLAASIASVIAMAGKEITIAENAMVMIHDPMAITMGTAGELRKQADVLDQIKETIINVYCTRTGKKRDTVSALMAEETWFTSEEAVKNKFADKNSKPMKIAASFNLKAFCYAKAPTVLTEPPKEEPPSTTTPCNLRSRRLALLEKTVT